MQIQSWTWCGPCWVKECQDSRQSREQVWVDRAGTGDTYSVKHPTSAQGRKEQRVQTCRAVMGPDKLVQSRAGSVMSSQ